MTDNLGHGSTLAHLGALFSAAQVLVEGRSFFEHLAHVGHGYRVPAAQVLVKGRSIFEHVEHVGHGSRVPPGEVLIELRSSE